MRPHDLWKIRFAYKQAKEGHRSQTREGGGRYFEHPRATVLILIDELDILDPDLIVAMILHDVPEDHWLIEIEDIPHIWGERVEGLVSALTKRDGESVESTVERIVAGGDWAILLKFCDRLHNVRTLDGCTVEKQRRKIEETRKYYLPLIEKVSPRLIDDVLVLKLKIEEELKALEAKL
ncbi:HD domain-containing protein [Candidatus Parcubacteria bacterium]|nr:HD domain-containing protein [Candidatus Parcubacteria bacterium]